MTEQVAEPEATPVPQETGEGETEVSQTSEVEETKQEETPAEPEEKKPKGVQKRIDELTANWRGAERDRDYWRDMAMKAQQSETKQPEPPSAPSGERPKLDDYQSYEEYTEALTDWKLDQRMAAQTKEAQDREAQAQQQQAQFQFNQRAQTVREDHPDFDAVVGNPTLPISEAMMDAAYASEKGPEVLYYLGQNPEEAHRIAQLQPIQAAMEMVRVEQSLERAANTNSSTPDPIPPVNAGGGRQSVDPDNMTTDEWLKWRESQLHKE